jgi:hypothetical protein
MSNLLKTFAFATLSTLAVLASARDASAQEIRSFPKDSAPATVAVESESPSVTVGVVTGRAFVAASNGATASGIAWKDACTTPCAFQVDPGMHELIVHGDGYVPATAQFTLRPGDNHFVVKPGSSAMRFGGWTALVLGATALTLGATFAAIGTTTYDSQGNATKSTPSWAIPTAVLGGVGVAGGITLMALSSTSIERNESTRATTSPPAPTGSTRAFGLALSGNL